MAPGQDDHDGQERAESVHGADGSGGGNYVVMYGPIVVGLSIIGKAIIGRS